MRSWGVEVQIPSFMHEVACERCFRHLVLGVIQIYIDNRNAAAKQIFVVVSVVFYCCCFEISCVVLGQHFSDFARAISPAPFLEEGGLCPWIDPSSATHAALS